MAKKLKIGFVVSSDEQLPAWYAETIRNVIAEDIHEIFFIVSCLPRENKTSWPLAYRLFRHFEDAWFGSAYDASEKIALSSFPQIQKIKSESQGFVFTDADKKRIMDLSPDLVYTIDYDGSQEENLSELASFGLWYINFGTEESSGPVGFWEVMRNHPVTGSQLLMKEKNRHSLLYDGSTPTVPHSVKNNFNSIAWKSSSYLLHRLRTLSMLYDNFSDHFSGVPQRKKVKMIPGNVEMSRLFVKNNLEYLAYRKKLKNKDRFTLLYAFENFRTLKDLPSQFQNFTLPGGCFFADPFVISKDSRYYVFFEWWKDEDGKASIAMMYWSGSKWSNPETVLEQPYHLSYPFVFKWGDDYYMLPESSSGKTLVLYKAASFPYKWEPVRTIFENGSLIDASLHFYGNKWWLFANSAQHPFVSTNDQLFLYYTDDLLNGSWTPHPMNPIATHAANCRPAGRLFEINGQLYRPAQNNASQQYGYGLKINQVEVMNATDYREKEVMALDPGSFDLKAIHHLDFTEGLVIIDGIMKPKD